MDMEYLNWLAANADPGPTLKALNMMTQGQTQGGPFTPIPQQGMSLVQGEQGGMPTPNPVAALDPRTMGLIQQMMPQPQNQQPRLMGGASPSARAAVNIQAPTYSQYTPKQVPGLAQILGVK